MRLRELEFPIGMLHPQEMKTIDDPKFFFRLGDYEVLRGYFESARFIDSIGREFEVVHTTIEHSSFWSKIPYLGDGSVRVDFDLRKIREFSASELIEYLKSFLLERPDWHWADEGPWNMIEVDQRFSGASTIPQIVARIGDYAVSEYQPLPDGISSKVIDLR